MVDRMNQVAMDIILNAGNGRTNIHQALKIATNDEETKSREEVNELIKQASLHINNAHKAQTEFMQETIESNLSVSVLFAHAQDTLMTIIAERNMAKYMIEFMYKVREERK